MKAPKLAARIGIWDPKALLDLGSSQVPLGPVGPSSQYPVSMKTHRIIPEPISRTRGPRRSSRSNKHLRNRKAKLVHTSAAPSGPSLSSEEEPAEEARDHADTLGTEDPRLNGAGKGQFGTAQLEDANLEHARQNLVVVKEKCVVGNKVKMQGAIARVCMVMAAAILNHPLLFPQENTTLPDQDQELIARMQEHKERLEREQARLEKELSQLDSKQEEPSSEEGYRWYFWRIVYFVIFLTIEMCRVQGGGDIEIWPVEDEDMLLESGSITPRTMVLDKNILSNFCDKCTYTSAHENWRVREFVEGFADDLLESFRSVCDREADMEVWDFVGIGSMFESWKVCKPLMCDLIVPFSPPDPYSYEFHLWCSPSSDMPPDMQGCGKIKVTRFGENEEGCLCGNANLGEDMLCLLHGKDDTLKVDHSPDELLCSRNTRFLSKDQVMKWFQISVTKAWGHISHKYDFEVTFRNLDAAGALKIRFRSGK
ncbi:hypothetical protein FQN60_014916, partial [Etheostoma spectabile]